MIVKMTSVAFDFLAASWIMWGPVFGAIAWWYIESQQTIIEHAPDKKPMVMYGTTVTPPGVLYIRWWLIKHKVCPGTGRLVATRKSRPWFRVIVDTFPTTLDPKEATGEKYQEFSYPVGYNLAPVPNNPKGKACYRTKSQFEYRCNWLFHSPVHEIEGPEFCVTRPADSPEAQKGP